jgi:hypothetical protein
MEQSGYQSTNQSMEQDDGRWLTYPELAAARGIDKASAIRLATRKHWRRQRDNRRVVRVLVPPEWLSPRYQSMDQSGDDDMDRSGDREGFAAALASVEAAHAGEVAALHGQITGLKALADGATARLLDAEGRAEKAEEALAGERARADTAEADRRATEARVERALARADQERVAADRFRGEAEAACGELAQAVERRTAAEVEARLLREAENARQQLGRWRRAWRGWRGR